MKKVLMIPVGLFLLLATVYWFNLDNKLIYYGVRPALNWWYDRKERDIRI